MSAQNNKAVLSADAGKPRDAVVSFVSVTPKIYVVCFPWTTLIVLAGVESEDPSLTIHACVIIFKLD